MRGCGVGGAMPEFARPESTGERDARLRAQEVADGAAALPRKHESHK